MTRFISLASVALLAMTAGARAQDAGTSFTLTALPGNIQGCVMMEVAFNRPLVVKVQGDGAELTSAGGVHSRMKAVRVNVYEGSIEVSGGQIVFVADLGATPRTLTGTSRNVGCKWQGTAQ